MMLLQVNVTAVRAWLRAGAAAQAEVSSTGSGSASSSVELPAIMTEIKVPLGDRAADAAAAEKQAICVKGSCAMATISLSHDEVVQAIAIGGGCIHAHACTD